MKLNSEELYEDLKYITGYIFAVEDIKEKINKWLEEDDLDSLYLIAKLSGYIDGILDTLKIKK